MPYPESTDLPIEIFGGYCTSIPPSDLPPGASPLCQDCMFPEASVRTRDGVLALANLNPPPAAGASFNGIANYGAPTLVNYMIDWDSIGDLYQIDQSGNLILINATVATAAGTNGSANLFMDSTTLFGREYMAFTNNSGLADFPRQWDGTNYDRVSQCGPGQAPTAVDANNLVNLLSLTPYNSAISAIFEVGNTVYVTPLTQDPLPGTGNPTLYDSGLATIGSRIIIAGTTNYNGTWNLTGVIGGGPSNLPFTYTFYNPTTGLAAESAGTVKTCVVAVIASQLEVIAGNNLTFSGVTPADYDGTWVVAYAPLASNTQAWVNVGTPGLATATLSGDVIIPGQISAGLHGISVAFITRQGYITKPPPPNYWTAAGSFEANITNIPIGPSNVVARLLIFTLAIQQPATTGTFYSIEAPVSVMGKVFSTSMLIQDNISTIATVNFRDTDLASAFNAQYLFSLIELGECSAVTNYNNRLVFLGELNRLRNVLNFSFNGGWNLLGGVGGSDVPLGWTSVATASDGITPNGEGGSRALDGGLWLDGYKITGNGTTAIRGMISQPISQDYLGVNILNPFTSYSVRLWIASVSITPGSQPTLYVDIFSPTAGQIGVGFFVLGTFAANQYSGTMLMFNSANAIPADALVRVYGNGVLQLGDYVILDSLEIYPTKQPINTGIAWISYAFDPESFDGTLSQVQVRPNDGQSLRATFTIRGNLYLGKDRYLAYVTDDGVNEPANWGGGVVEVSDTIGISGPKAVDVGEEWAVFANRNGAYIFWGSDPMKLTQGIQEDASHSGKDTWNSINWNAATTIWVVIDNLQKRILVGAPLKGAITPNIVWEMDYKFAPGGAEITSDTVYSAFMNKLITHGGGMKWNPWNITANSCGLIEFADGTQKTVFGSSLGDSNLNVLTAGQLSDNGTAINWIYTTYGQPSAEEEESLQLKAHVKQVDYITGRAVGAGTMSLVVVTATRATPVRGIALSANPVSDFERNVNVLSERAFYQVGTNAVGEWAQLEKLIGMQKQSPTIPVRGFGP